MFSASSVDVITPQQLQELILSGNSPIILDVRETVELQICALPNSLHIPLGNLTNEWENLPKDQPIVVLCHHGYRSMQAASFLKSLGFNQVMNLHGGIHAWAKQIDNSLQIY
jgi:rhodanese-related sulfurtransferase